ncbi:MAG: hypothetical protein N3A69_05675 [Leptospiraceae bacterium]|nr:hypothetical protein [Leptospiraceae bacterium]
MNFFSITRKALQEEKKHNFTKAFNLFTKAQELTEEVKSKIKIQAHKGYCLNSVGNTKEAEELFCFLPIEYKHPESFLQTALYFITIENFNQAKTYLKEGIEKFPEYLELYLTLAFILKETGRQNESIEVLKKALSQKRLSNGKGGISRKDIWVELGNLYFERGNLNSCIECLKKALRMEDEIFMHYDLLALCYLKLDDLNRALEFIDRHLANFENTDAKDYILKARILSRMGNLEEAMQILKNIYELEGELKLKNEEMRDFSPLVRTGFFETLENYQIE